MRPDTLFTRVGCLLHCPIDTPQLWPQVLSLLGDALGCTAGQLFLPRALSASNCYSWQAEGVEIDCAMPSAEVVSALWQHLGIDQSEVTVLWPHQASDLKTQLMTLAKLAADGNFHLSGTKVYSSENWPSSLVPIFGRCQGQQLIFLPLRNDASELSLSNLPPTADEDLEKSSKLYPFRDMYAATDVSQVVDSGENGGSTAQPPSCLGVLVLSRAEAQGRWLASDQRLIESIATQIYLALRRSHLDQVACTRSAYDQLTQLPDRVLFNQQLARSILTAAEQDTMLGVAFLDLDRFKNINDTLGHEIGDCLLQQVADRLKGCLRGYDVVARWGGDEFTLLLSNLRSAEDVSNIAERLLHRLSVPFQVQGEELYVTASLGIALAPYDGEDGQTLLRNADAAMYQAKSRGRNNYQVYFKEINADARIQLNLENDLRKAVDNGELFLCYQPQVDLRSGQWVGLEALIRWQHPTLGLISPAKFIPIAEETGLIEPIGQWVLQASCAQYGEWQAMGMPKIRLAVNLSAHQFNRSYLVRSILQVLKATNFDPRYLELEVTESAAMRDVSLAISLLNKLSHAGMQIAMDDFGTGYSSLSVLKHFPLDTLKIDRSFVMDLVDSPSDAAIASTIIALAKGLNFKVLAEGIETPEQVAALTDMGCDYAQGYWFSHPLTVKQIDELLLQKTFYKVAKI